MLCKLGSIFATELGKVDRHCSQNHRFWWPLSRARTSENINSARREERIQKEVGSC